MITLEPQSTTGLDCPNCGREFRRLEGAFRDDEGVIGVYLIDLHRHGEPTAHVAMSTVDRHGGLAALYSELRWIDGAFSLMVRTAPADSFFQQRFGAALLSRDEALTHPLKETFFHLSDHLTLAERTLRQHFGLDADA
jgi:hypothetical protein